MVGLRFEGQMIVNDYAKIFVGFYHIKSRFLENYSRFDGQSGAPGCNKHTFGLTYIDSLLVVHHLSRPVKSP